MQVIYPQIIIESVKETYCFEQKFCILQYVRLIDKYELYSFFCSFISTYIYLSNIPVIFQILILDLND